MNFLNTLKIYDKDNIQVSMVIDLDFRCKLNYVHIYIIIKLKLPLMDGK